MTPRQKKAKAILIIYKNFFEFMVDKPIDFFLFANKNAKDFTVFNTFSEKLDALINTHHMRENWQSKDFEAVLEVSEIVDFLLSKDTNAALFLWGTDEQTIKNILQDKNLFKRVGLLFSTHRKEPSTESAIKEDYTSMAKTGL